MKIQIYTDGCCLGNQSSENRGGWAFVLNEGGIPEHNKSGAELNTTNQRMEIMACIEAMAFVRKHYNDIKSVEILSDSAYVVNCVKDGWYLKWIRNGWISSKGEPVKNKDLWEVFIEGLEDRYFKFTHVRGHSGDKWNEWADKLAKNAAEAAK